MATRALILFLSLYQSGVVFGAETCWEKRDLKKRKHYNGTINLTMFGTLCQRWDSNKPHQHDRKDPSMFPDDASVSDAGNYCRDPYGDGTLYCYTTNPHISQERCSIPECSSPGYHMARYGSDFLRCRYVPESGECDPFNEEHFCMGQIYRPLFSEIARENCKVPLCCERRGCRNGESHEYDGQWSITNDGQTCRYWGGDLQSVPEPDYFPEQSLQNASNYCRDPDLRGYTWCYTDKRNFKGVLLDFPCSIPSCDEFVQAYYDHTCYHITDEDRDMHGGDEKAICESVPDRLYLSKDVVYPGCSNDCSCCVLKRCYIGDSRNYTGSWPITARGLKCKSWVDTSIGEDPALFPDDTVADAHNYCRHTSIHDDRGLWCYTDDPNIPEDSCDLKQCIVLPTQAPPTKASEKQPTTAPTATSLLSNTTNNATVIVDQTANSSRACEKGGRILEKLFFLLLAYTCTYMCAKFVTYCHFV